MALKNLFGYILLGSLILLIGLTFGVITWAVGQDYVIYELGQQSELLYNSSTITNASYQNIVTLGNDHASLDYWFDWGYVLGYVIFFISAIVVAYYTREVGYFSFLNNLFIVIMILLFFISIVTTFSDWWITNVLFATVPAIENSLVKFSFINDYIGLLSFVQMVLCILANRFYLNIKNTFNKVGSEFDDSEDFI